MDSSRAAELLRQAEENTTQGRQSGKWFARYLNIFGIASIPFCLLYGWSIGYPTRLIFVMIVWGILVVAAAFWSSRQRGALRITKKISAAAFASWGIAWGITVIVGTTYLKGSFLWWLGGGLVMAAIMFAAAAYTVRQTR